MIELPSLRVLKQINLTRGRMNDAAFTKSGRYLIAAGDDSLIRVFNGESLKEELQFTGMPRHNSRLAISPDERTIAVAHEKGPVTLWHLPTGRHLAELPLPEEGPFPVRQVLFTSDGRHLVVCLDDRSIVAFDTRY
jgi:WD40 repeat protein